MTRPAIAVIGGGNAGSGGSLAAEEFGLEVLLFEQFEASPEVREHLQERSISAVEAGAAPALKLQDSTPVWGLFPGWTVAASRFGEPVVERVDAVLIATGATDRYIPFAGSSQPGVVTASGLTRLVDVHHLLPGQRFVVIGDGFDAKDAVERITRSGGEIVLRIAEENARSMTALGPDGIHAVAVDGSVLETDIVVMAAGRNPDLLLAAMAECELDYDPEGETWVVRRDFTLQTSAPGVWAAGDVAGCTDPVTARTEGRFAAAAIASWLGILSDERFDQERDLFEQSTLRTRVGVGTDACTIRQPWLPSLAIPRQDKD